MEIEKLIKRLDGADVFLRGRANAKPAPLNYYDVECLLDIAKVCDEAARMLEKAIFPPCKVGTTIYEAIWLKKKEFSHFRRCEVVGFHMGEFPVLRPFNKSRDNYLIVLYCECGHLAHIPFDKIGKTVFFEPNLEEATKAYEEMKRCQTTD